VRLPRPAITIQQASQIHNVRHLNSRAARNPAPQRFDRAAVLRPYVATVLVACPPAALTGALSDIVADASVIRNALDCSLPVAAPIRLIAAERAVTAVWELAVATVDSSGLKLGVAYGAHDLPDAMHRAGRAASALITVLSDRGIVAAGSGTVNVARMEAT
jgi:hypothetical protein